MMKQEHRVEVKTAPGRRAKALLWAHLLRINLEDQEMKSGTSSYMSDQGVRSGGTDKQNSRRSSFLSNLFSPVSSTSLLLTTGSTPLPYVCSSSPPLFKLYQPASPLWPSYPVSQPNGRPRWKSSTRPKAESGSRVGTRPLLRMCQRQRRSPSFGQSWMSHLLNSRVSPILL
jgi:hypothetical protein